MKKHNIFNKLPIIFSILFLTGIYGCGGAGIDDIPSAAFQGDGIQEPTSSWNDESVFRWESISDDAGDGNQQNDSQEAEENSDITDSTDSTDTGDPKDSNDSIKIRKGTPTLGGQHCPSGSEVIEGSNDTKGRVVISGSENTFTCTIHFSEPHPAPPICVFSGSGWVTPATLTIKAHNTTVDYVEVQGDTAIDPDFGMIFNYICL